MKQFEQGTIEYKVNTCTIRQFELISSLANVFQDLVGPIISFSKLRVNY